MNLDKIKRLEALFLKMTPHKSGVKQSDPLTNRRNQVIYRGYAMLYLDEALKSILDLD